MQEKLSLNPSMLCAQEKVIVEKARGSGYSDERLTPPYTALQLSIAGDPLSA